MIQCRKLCASEFGVLQWAMKKYSFADKDCKGSLSFSDFLVSYNVIAPPQKKIKALTFGA